MNAIYFTSKGCPPCRKMLPIIEKLIAEGYQIVIVNVSTSPEQAESYKITGTPTLVILEDKREIKRFVGVVSEEEIRRVLKKSLDYRVW